MKTRCLLVDDEPIALEILETYVSRVPSLQIVGRCSNAIEAAEVLRGRRVDLMFLDIRMPGFDGVAFLQSLVWKPAVILTTAYRDYAVDGYDLDIIDYLLKPVPFERFMKAIERYYASIPGKAATASGDLQNSEVEPCLDVKADRKMVRIRLRDILYFESMKDYVTVHKRDGSVTTRETMEHLEGVLPHDLFLRIHRSYIISLTKVGAFTAETVEIGKKELPVARNYRRSVAAKLGGQPHKSH